MQKKSRKINRKKEDKIYGNKKDTIFCGKLWG